MTQQEVPHWLDFEHPVDSREAILTVLQFVIGTLTDEERTNRIRSTEPACAWIFLWLEEAIRRLPLASDTEDHGPEETDKLFGLPPRPEPEALNLPERAEAKVLDLVRVSDELLEELNEYVTDEALSDFRERIRAALRALRYARD